MRSPAPVRRGLLISERMITESRRVLAMYVLQLVRRVWRLQDDDDDRAIDNPGAWIPVASSDLAGTTNGTLRGVP